MSRKIFFIKILYNYLWIFLFVGYRDDVYIEEMELFKVAFFEFGRWGWRLSVVIFELFFDDVVVELFIL